MDQLKRMAVFAEVVDAGSFSAAARRLRMTPSAVSQHIKQLEAALGLALIQRTTRKLTLTEAGARYAEGCRAMVHAAHRAAQALELHRDEPEGELRITAPLGLAKAVAQVLAPLRQYPKLTLHLLLDDALIDLIDERVDIALRVGQLCDSTLVASRIGCMEVQLCAAPTYLAERGWPQEPHDLASHDWLGYNPPTQGAEEVLQLQHTSGEQVAVAVRRRTFANKVPALHALCVAGWGISGVVSEDDRQALHNGLLLPVLPAWKLPAMPIFAIAPRRSAQPAKIRYALELLAAHFGKP
jgi:LysR family transcriptional regulator, transcriptional activator for aaeXAB operon